MEFARIFISSPKTNSCITTVSVQAQSKARIGVTGPATPYMLAVGRAQKSIPLEGLKCPRSKKVGALPLEACPPVATAQTAPPLPGNLSHIM